MSSELLERTGYEIRPLDASTWDAFAALALKHNGVWGGCWCTYFHRGDDEESLEALRAQYDGADLGRAWKELRVRDGRAHAALVFDGDAAIAWCEYGPPAELPNIYYRKQIERERAQDPDDVPADYRITCFFVDRDHRRRGVSAIALDGALGLIAQAGGGVVESYPHDTQGEKTSASFLHNGTRSMFERAGFRYVRPAGKRKCVVRATVEGPRGTPSGRMRRASVTQCADG